MNFKYETQKESCINEIKSVSEWVVGIIWHWKLKYFD